MTTPVFLNVGGVDISWGRFFWKVRRAVISVDAGAGFARQCRAMIHELAALLIEFEFNTDNMGAKDQPALVGRVTRSLGNGLGRG